MTGMVHRLVHDQRGMVRGLVLLFVIFAVIAALALDFVSVLTSGGQLREHVQNAAHEAVATFVDTGSDGAAQAAAERYLDSQDETLVLFSPTHVNGKVNYLVRAQAQVHTYLLKYLTRLPWGAGDWVKKQLTHTATERDG
jgi:hypothetical protein